jgi:hypothetical protein
MPRLVCDIVKDVACRDPDLEAVVVAADAAGLARAIRDENPDVVVTWLIDNQVRVDIERVLDVQQRLRVIGVTVDGAEAFLHELRPQRAVLGVATIEKLVRAIRGDRAEPGLETPT